ncbi:restriction endonuclease subunit S [Pseudomonas aeruginosa]|uniref:restriction endonuclease subunit S n=1 Tax=Pseudomonas aeruginosa TaxID=287 RepID=UPI002078A20A|nr:restriction endonuclease subunit S [Pseudomonas aeruginosa]
MSGKEQRPLVPRLRFPEFRAKDGWGCEFGNLIFDQISNKNHNSDLPVLAITQEQGAIPRDMIDYHVSVTDKSLEGYKVVEVGNFIISLRSFQGGIEFSKYRGICSPAYVILRLRSDHSEDYFRHYLKTGRFIARMTKNLEGLRDGKMISYKQFSELELPTPSRSEQQKIADCLSSLDDLIAAETQKFDTLKTYKKGLMLQLFPAKATACHGCDFRNSKMATNGLL